MADLEEANLLTCGRCERQCSGTQPRPGASQCDKCDQWVMKEGLLHRLMKAIGG